LIKQDVLDGVMQDFRFAWSWLVYISADFEEDKAKYLERVAGPLKELDEKLGKQQYLLGDYLSYNDFVFFEILEINSALFGAELLKKYPNLEQYHGRIGNLKGVKEYMQSDRNPKKYNGPSAKWGG
jgi:glutathione S-transferase